MAEPWQLTDEEREQLLFGFGFHFYEKSDHELFAQGVAAAESIKASAYQAGQVAALTEARRWVSRYHRPGLVDRATVLADLNELLARAAEIGGDHE